MTKRAKRKTTTKSARRKPIVEGVQKVTIPEMEAIEPKPLMESVKEFIAQLSPVHLFYLLFLLYFIPLPFFGSPAAGLDPSWQIAINLAIRENLLFGKEFIFTYGPLGYIETRIPDFVPNWPIILFQLFIYVNAIIFILFWITNETIKNRFQKNHYIFIPVILVLFGPVLFEPKAFILLFYSLFYMVLYLLRRDVRIIPVLSLCCLIAFYLKVNSGIVCNILFILFMLYILIRRILPVFSFLIIVGAHFAVLYLASIPLHTDIISYISNSVFIISSYNDAMYYLQKVRSPIIGALCVILLAYPLFLWIKALLKSPQTLFLSFLFGACIFIYFKKGFVRSDMVPEHCLGFFSIIPFIGILMYIALNPIHQKFTFVTYLLPITFLCLLGSQYKPVVNRLNGISEFILNTADPGKKIKQNQLNLDGRRLPDEVLERIKGKTVDVMGSEISYIYFNDLYYSPRPVIQSYSAYDPHLIQKNVDRYNGPEAPDYVLYHFSSIDRRHPFWDEPLTYLPILSRYKIAFIIQQNISIGNMILFEKKAEPSPVSSQVVLDTVVHLEEDFLIPPSDNFLYLSMDYEYTFPGKLRRLFFQPGEVKMRLFENETTSYIVRLVLPVMKSGVLINKSVKNREEGLTFFQSKGAQNINILAFRLTGDPLWIKDEFRIRLTEYKIRE